MSLTDCTPENLATHLASAPAAILDIWADWCPNCRALTGVLERFQPDFAGRIAFLRLDHGAYPEVGEQHGIRSLPALLFYREGKVAEIVQGFVPAPALRARLNAFAQPGPFTPRA